MPLNPAPITVKDAANADKAMVAFNDGTNNAFAQAVLDADGTIISPATEAKQDTAITHLSQIETATEATATAMTAANSSLDAIETSTGSTVTALAAANTSLDAIEASVAAGATSANQTAANGKLDTIIANTGAGSVLLTASPTVAGATHAPNDVVGGKISLANAVRANAGAGIIQTVTVNVADAVTAAYDVLFFATDPTNSTFTDDAAIALAAADQPFLIGVAQCTTIVDCGTRKTLQAANVALPFKLSTGTTLFAVIVARGSAAYTTANGVKLNVAVVQD